MANSDGSSRSEDDQPDSGAEPQVSGEDARLEPKAQTTLGGGARRLARSTAIFASATGVSRVLGLVREIVVRRYFGVEGSINAFTVAFQVPNLVRALVADVALSSAFVPVFSELLEKGDRARAWRVASTIFWIMALGLAGLTALFIVLAPWILRPFGYDGADEQLVIGLSRVMFPTVALLGVSGVIVGILNSYDHFTAPAMAPILWNVAIIGALVVGVPFFETDTDKLYLYAGAVLAGTVLQVLLPVPWLRRRDGSIRAVLDLRDPAVPQMFRLMLPVTLSLGLINVNLLVDTFFAARFVDRNLAPSSIEAAFRIYMLPQGVFSVAVAAVLFPMMSRLAARGDTDELRNTVSLGLRQIGFLLIPASALAAALSLPIVRVLYERGEFGASETDVVASALAAFAAGLTFNGMMLLLNRAFFSLQAPWVPTWIALGVLGLNLALDAALYRVGVWGIPLATSIVNVAGTVMLLWFLRARLERINGRELILSFVRIVIAAALTAGVGYEIWDRIDGAVGRSLGGQVVSVGVAVVGASLVYLIIARMLAIRELNALLSLIRRERV
ncbi:MAG: murein biosynthesis integral membrane protein MurJ [Gaiellaceae bacterium]